jgi:O-antigen/teichoic acid export membrane protein
MSAVEGGFSRVTYVLGVRILKNSALKNASWIIACKIVQSLISLVIGMISARYLGPSNYGVITYVSSVVAFALPIMQLGLNQTLVKEFVQNPDREGTVLGTALTINILSSFVGMAGSVAFVFFVNAGETETILVCALYSLSLLFQATEMIHFWFQSKLLSKYPSLATLCAYIVVALYKIFLLVSKKSIAWFAVSNVLDYFLISVILMVIYFKIGSQKLRVSWRLGREMLSRSKYYIIPSLMVMIFQHTDRIMIKLMIGETETGFYSAAITCIGISSFVFAAVIDSMRPVILGEKEKNPEMYEKRVSQLYSIITCLSLAQSIAMTLLAKPLVFILYGPEYTKTAGILCVAVWYVTFSYYGSVRNVWILAEGKQKYLFGINVIGAAANIILNWFLIPLWGGVGAAVASLITQFFTNVIIGFIFKPIRENNRLMLKGLNPKIPLDMVRELLHRR